MAQPLPSPRQVSPAPRGTPKAHSPEIVLLIFTKIFSKSAKSLQEDWNMCMKRLMNRFSILQTRRQRPLSHSLWPCPPRRSPLHTAASWATRNQTQGSSEGAADWLVEPGQKPAPTLMLSLLHLPWEGNWPVPSRTVYSASNPSTPAFVHAFTHSSNFCCPPWGPASRHRVPSSYAATPQSPGVLGDAPLRKFTFCLTLALCLC